MVDFFFFFFAQLLNLPDLILRFNSFLLHLSRKASAAVALPSLTTFASRHSLRTGWVEVIAAARLLNDCDVWLWNNVGFQSRFRPVITAPVLVSDDCLTRLAKTKGARQLFLLQRRVFVLAWTPARIYLVDHLVWTSGAFYLGNHFSSLSVALPLSPTRCPLAALSRSDRPLLASQAFKAPPTSSPPRVPSDSSSLLHLRTARIARSRDAGSHATHHSKCGQSVISDDPIKLFKFE